MDRPIGIGQLPSHKNGRRTMRFGVMAAAAAALLCAGQADAARYYEFQLNAASEVPVDYFSPLRNSYTTTITASFDSQAASGGMVYTPLPDGNLVFFFLDGGLWDDANKGGSKFNLGFSLASIPVSETLVQIPVFGQYTYRQCYTPSACRSDGTGGIISLLARTSDIAPVKLGATEVLNVTVVPEPAAWAMMIAGFGLVGGLARRRKRSLATA